MDFKKAKLKKHINLTPDVIELTFESLQKFEFKAGQFISVKISSQENEKAPTIRIYSIADRPENQSFQLCVKVLENGIGSNYLNNLKEGEEMEFLGPMGAFVFTTTPEKEALFIATGTGLSPLKSILEDELKFKNNTQKMHLVFGLRYIKDIFYKDFFDSLAQKYPNFTYTFALSQPEDPSWQEQGGFVGRVTNLLKELPLNPEETETYACGIKVMVDETTKILQEKGIPPEAIHSENF